MNDIETLEDTMLLVDSFYAKVKTDDLLGPIFNQRFRVNWEKHLPVMYRFWQNVLFYSGGYDGNPIVTHSRLSKKLPFTEKHFERWTQLFKETVDENFAGEKAKLAKQRAYSIATIMQLKLSPAVI